MTYHLKLTRDDWELTQEGNEKPLASFGSKSDAVKRASLMVEEQTGSLKIHNADGTIEEERNYPRTTGRR
jgi:hypothetical protein